MAQSKSSALAAAERLAPFVEDASRTHFNGEAWRGFKFWALGEVLIDSDLSDDELKAAVEIDGRSDLGLDGYVEDPESETLILVQSKYHERPTAVGSDELAKFLDGMPARLLNPTVAAASPNPLVNDAHRALRDAIANGWRLRFIFLCAGWLTAEGGVPFAESHKTSTQAFDSLEIARDLEVYDWPALAALYDSHLVALGSNTDVTFDLTGVPFHEAKSGGFKVIVITLPARQLVSAFEAKGYALFQLNPRGPLKNRTNSRIKATLQDRARQELFYLFNNGVTALCESWKKDGDILRVRAFQIVNGCQTTVTLASVAPIVAANPEIKVPLRLIEGPGHMTQAIAEATNTQTRLTAEDFKSNDKLQRDLKKQFDSLPQPIFYEIKRGDWEPVSRDKTLRERYKEPIGQSFRRVKMKDVAQATLAFLGEPGRAKDQSRAIFDSGEVYAKVFPPNVRAQQLMVPMRLYEEADRVCSAWNAQYAPYARYCLVALAGSRLRKGDSSPRFRMPGECWRNRTTSWPRLNTARLSSRR